MSKRQKLYQRILDKPKDLRFEELEKAILDCGYRYEHTTGSHAYYTKPGNNPLSVPRKSPIKSRMIDEALLAISDCLEEML